MARRKTNPGDDPSAPTFEDALAGLEAIVEAMENQQLPLEDLVSHYEKGAELLDRCESILQSARGRIELITLRNHNEIDNESAPAAGQLREDLPPSDVPDDSDDDDDIRLF